MQSCAKNNHDSIPLSPSGIFAGLFHNLCCLSLKISQTERDAEIFFVLVLYCSFILMLFGGLVSRKKGSSGCIVFPNLRELC